MVLHEYNTAIFYKSLLPIHLRKIKEKKTQKGRIIEYVKIICHIVGCLLSFGDLGRCCDVNV